MQLQSFWFAEGFSTFEAAGSGRAAVRAMDRAIAVNELHRIQSFVGQGTIIATGELSERGASENVAVAARRQRGGGYRQASRVRRARLRRRATGTSGVEEEVVRRRNMFVANTIVTVVSRRRTRLFVNHSCVPVNDISHACKGAIPQFVLPPRLSTGRGGQLRLINYNNLVPICLTTQRLPPRSPRSWHGPLAENDANPSNAFAKKFFLTPLRPVIKTS